MNETAERILKLLRKEDAFVSGEAIGRALSISRNAVWKQIRALKERGYEISSSTNRGYRLKHGLNIPLGVEVKPFLSAEFLGGTIEYHDTVDSTNRLAADAARRGGAEGMVITADSQSAGKGRLNRHWDSPPGINLYFSVILRPPIEPARAPQLALVAAVAVHRALAGFCPAMAATIKWPNDILAGGKKIVGILCETGAEFDRIHYAVVGIGMNVNGPSMPPSLRSTATSLMIETGEEHSRPRLLAAVLNCLEEEYVRWRKSSDLKGSLDYLQAHSALQGRLVTAFSAGVEVKGAVTAVSPGGELVIETAPGELLHISSGDVRLFHDRDTD